LQLVCLGPTAAHAADTLPDRAHLIDLAPGRARIMVQRPHPLTFVDGVSSNSVWFADCEGQVPGGFNGEIKLAPDDFLVIETVGHVEGDVAFDVSVVLKNVPKSSPPPKRLRLLCAHKLFGLFRASDYNVSTVADLRRAFGWDVTVEGELAASAAAVKGK